MQQLEIAFSGEGHERYSEWMNEMNGVWTQEFNDLVDVVANFTQNWLEDNISEQLLDEMQKTVDKLQRIWYYIYRVKRELSERGNQNE